MADDTKSQFTGEDTQKGNKRSSVLLVIRKIQIKIKEVKIYVHTNTCGFICSCQKPGNHLNVHQKINV